MELSNLIEKVMERRHLTKEECNAAVEEMVLCKSPLQSAAFLAALQTKGITVEELSAFADELRKRAIPVNVKDAIDVCGTGGDHSGTFNISTAAAIILAGAGIKVAKHGNKAVSSSCGSADVLSILGIPINFHAEQAEEAIQKTNFGFIFAPNFHKAFKNIMPVRKELQVKTMFNMLGPLLNPAQVKGQVIGVFKPELTELFAEVLKKRGLQRAMVVHGSGLDEITITGETKITELREGKIRTYTVKPEDFGIKRAGLEEIKGKDAEFNANIIRKVLNPKEKDNPYRDIALINAAAGFVVAGKADNLKEGVALAKNTILSGKAWKKLKDLNPTSACSP
jgi:anthranilate phosphoribosyltransferase